MLSSLIKMVGNCEGVPMYLKISSYVPPPKVTGGGGGEDEGVPMHLKISSYVTPPKVTGPGGWGGGDILISFDNGLILSWGGGGHIDFI